MCLNAPAPYRNPQSTTKAAGNVAGSHRKYPGAAQKPFDVNAPNVGRALAVIAGGWGPPHARYK